MNPCPFCGSPLLLESIPARYGCGTLVTDKSHGSHMCVGRSNLWPEVQRLRAENDRLRDIIRRASIAYCCGGNNDSERGAEMFHILAESFDQK